MEAFLQNITVKANTDCKLAGNEEEDFEDFEFLETLDGLLINLPKFFGISDQLMDQMLEFYFYDVTKIGKYFSTDEGRNTILKTFGIPSDLCLDKLYLLVPSDVDSDYVCTRCNNTVKGNDFFSLVCGHFFCRQCWISSIQEGSLCCLEENCNCKMPFIDAQNLYPEIDAEKFKSMIRLLTQLDYEKKLLTRGKDLNCCPNCGKQIEFQYVNFGCIFCRQCKKFYCLKCRQEAHLPLSCQENHEFKSLVSKYSSMPKELNEYKQYHNCKIRLDQEKKEIQRIIHFTLKENNVKIDEALNRNLSSIRSIYETIQNNLSNNNDFDNYEILNDQDFLNNNDELNVFKEKYPSQFVYLLDNYKNIIKKEEEVKVHFKDISRLIEELESVSSLPSYFYDLSIILDYKPLNEDFVYEEQQFEVDFEVGSDIDEDPSNLNDPDVLNTNSDDNSQPIFNDNVNGDDELKSSLDIPSLNSNEEISSYGIESYLANNNDNSKSNICNNNDESYENNDNNGNNNDNNGNNNDNNGNNNDNNGNNNNDNNNNYNEQMQTDEELLRQKEKMLEEYQRELQSQFVPKNPLQDALNSYINAFKENSNGINMPMQQYDIENDESAVEYSINKYLILIFRNHKNAFLHFNRKNKSLKHLQLLCANVERFLFENDEKMKYDLQYYLILIRYFSTHLD